MVRFGTYLPWFPGSVILKNKILKDHIETKPICRGSTNLGIFDFFGLCTVLEALGKWTLYNYVSLIGQTLIHCFLMFVWLHHN